MKQTILALAMMLIAATFAFAQSKDEQEIRKTLEIGADALVKNDLAVLSNLLADDLTFITSDGQIFSKSQFLDGIKHTKRESFGNGDVSVRVYGNTAVVVSHPTFTEVRGNGLKTNYKEVSISVLVKKNGRWQTVSVQGSANKADNQAAVEAQLTEILKIWGNAVEKRDTAAIEKKLPEDFMNIAPNGAVETRAQYLEAIKKFPGETTVTGEVGKTSVTGNTAVLTGRYSVTPKAGGQAVNYSYSAVFALRDGSWMPVSFQATLVAQ